MNIRLHYLQHVPFEGLGSIESWAKTNGHTVSSTQLHAGGALPSLEALDWLIVMGGPMGVHDDITFPWLVAEKRFIERAIATGKVVLGVCLGAQLIADVLGAKVYPNREKEIGWFPVDKTPEADNTRVFGKFPSKLEVFHWHGDTFDLPTGAIHVTRSTACANQAFVYDDRVVGLQFHLETTRQSAEQLIENCANELVEGPFIQTADTMLSNSRRFDTINTVMAQLLDELGRTTG